MKEEIYFQNKTMSNMNHRPMTGVNRNVGNRKQVNQIKINKPNDIVKPSIKRLRNSSMINEEKINMAGSTTNVQTSTQPTTMSVIIPKIQENISKSTKNKDGNINISNPNSKSYNNAGISYQKYDNPQNDLNIWRSSVIRTKLIPEQVNVPKDGK